MLLAKLAEIKEARLLGTQAVAALDPLLGKPFTLSLTFLSASRTFGNSYHDAYDDGHTLICKLGEEGLEATVLIVPEEEELVESLNPGEVFEARLSVLDFDALYQRPVLGQYLGDLPAEEEEPREPETIEEQEPEQWEETPEEEHHEEQYETEETYEPEPEQEQPPATKASTGSPLEGMLAAGQAGRESTEGAAAECPKGHGPLRSWEGRMVCWTCGWSDSKKTPPRRSGQKKRPLRQTRSQQKTHPKKPPQPKTPEIKGCNKGCRFGLGGLLLLMSLISCSQGGEGFGVFTFLIALFCYWPLIKQKIDEQQS